MKKTAVAYPKFEVDPQRFFEQCPIEIIKVYWNANPRKLGKAFKKHGQTIDSRDKALALATSFRNGDDVRGINGLGGRLYAFDTMAVINQEIQLTEAEQARGLGISLTDYRTWKRNNPLSKDEAA